MSRHPTFHISRNRARTPLAHLTLFCLHVSLRGHISHTGAPAWGLGVLLEFPTSSSSTSIHRQSPQSLPPNQILIFAPSFHPYCHGPRRGTPYATHFFPVNVKFECNRASSTFICSVWLPCSWSAPPAPSDVIPTKQAPALLPNPLPPWPALPTLPFCRIGVG